MNSQHYKGYLAYLQGKTIVVESSGYLIHKASSKHWINSKFGKLARVIENYIYKTILYNLFKSLSLSFIIQKVYETN